MMPKGDTIAAIMRLNRSVDAGFLAEFSEGELAAYLGRLEDTCGSMRAFTACPPSAAQEVDLAVTSLAGT